jgi:hypothetical protein
MKTFLDGDRHAGQRAQRSAAPAHFVDRSRFSPRGLEPADHHGIQLPIHRLDPRQAFFQNVAGGALAGVNLSGDFRRAGYGTGEGFRLRGAFDHETVS